MHLMMSRKMQIGKTLAVILLSIAWVTLAAAQAPHLATADGPDGAPVEFDVVSIHPSDPEIQTENLNYDPGLFKAEGVTLAALIQSAFNVKDFQIQGLPPQLEHKKYDIVAKMLGPSREAAWQLSDLKVVGARDRLYEKRIQNILVTRFGLKYHVATKKGSILILRKSSERQLKMSVAGGHEDYLRMHNVEGGMQIDGKNQTIDALASELTYVFHTTIRNETGLPAKYDFRFSWRGDESAADTNLPDINTAIREALGVKVEKSTGDVQYYVIDQLEAPSPN